MFHIATEKEIIEGKVTDVYFERTLEVLRKKGIDKHVTAEIICKGFPDGWEWAVLAGLDECLAMLQKLDIRVRALDEGRIFRANEPVLEIEGMYSVFCKYETAILGLLCQASGIATRACRCKAAAGDKTVLSFGARRMHPAIAPMIERNAYLGGCDGVAVVKSAQEIGINPSGTMPHALILIVGDTLKAAQAFDEVIDPAVQRIILIDTFNDERTEAIRLANALGEKFKAIRIDTPASRRGNLKEIVREVRWELDRSGSGRIKIFVSGGITEHDIEELRDDVDGFGVGTFISNAPVIDFAMDIVDIEGKPFSKRGKLSGKKSVLTCSVCGLANVTPKVNESIPCDCGGIMEERLNPVLNAGQNLFDFPGIEEIRRRLFRQVKDMNRGQIK